MKINSKPTPPPLETEQGKKDTLPPVNLSAQMQVSPLLPKMQDHEKKS